MLEKHLEFLVQKYAIRSLQDFDDIPPIRSAAEYEALQTQLQKLPPVKHSAMTLDQYVLGNCKFKILLRSSPVWEVNVYISSRAPFWYSRFLSPRYQVAIDAEFLKCRNPDFDMEMWIRKAEECKAPSRIHKLARSIFCEIAAFGLVEIPRDALLRQPQRAAKVPRSLRRCNFKSLYFS